MNNANYLWNYITIANTGYFNFAVYVYPNLNTLMEQQTNFTITRTQDNKVQFTSDEITIIVGAFSYNDGKHEIIDPQTANAHFICCGEKYYVDNTMSINTIEDWYLVELLPKMQMLNLLFSTT